MAKTALNGNFKWVALLITVGSIVFAAGGLNHKVTTVATEAHRIDVDGCKPSVEVRKDMSGVKANIANMQKTLERIEDKVDDLK